MPGWKRAVTFDENCRSNAGRESLDFRDPVPSMTGARVDVRTFPQVERPESRLRTAWLWCSRDLSSQVGTNTAGSPSVHTAERLPHAQRLEPLTRSSTSPSCTTL